MPFTNQVWLLEAGAIGLHLAGGAADRPRHVEEVGAHQRLSQRAEATLAGLSARQRAPVDVLGTATKAAARSRGARLAEPQTAFAAVPATHRSGFGTLATSQAGLAVLR